MQSYLLLYNYVGEQCTSASDNFDQKALSSIVRVLYFKILKVIVYTFI